MWRRLWLNLVSDWCWHLWSLTKFSRYEDPDGFVFHSYSAKCLKCGKLWQSPRDPRPDPYGGDNGI